jgi:hypothetical protein
MVKTKGIKKMKIEIKVRKANSALVRMAQPHKNKKAYTRKNKHKTNF